MRVIPTALYKRTSKQLSPIEKSRVRMLVEHWTKGGKLSGKDSQSGGVYAGRNMRHFHVAEPDLLLHYQLTKEALVLLAIGSHVDFFGAKEEIFLDSIKDELLESLTMRYFMDLIIV